MSNVSARFELGIEDGNYSVVIKTTVGDAETRRVVLKTTSKVLATSLRNELQSAYETGIANGELKQLATQKADMEMEVATLRDACDEQEVDKPVVDEVKYLDLDAEVDRLSDSLKTI